MMMMTTPTTLRTKLAWGALIGTIVLSVATCRVDMLLKSAAQATTAALNVSPTEVRDSARAGSDEIREIDVTIANAGDGGFTWSATKKKGWVALDPTSGGVPATLTIALDAHGLSPGTYEDTVTIHAPGLADSTARIAVTFVVQRAGLNVSPRSLTHITNVNSDAVFRDTLRITNSGSGTLIWTANESEPWITLGAIAGVGPGTLPVTIDSRGLPSGTHTGDIVIAAPGAEGSPARVPVTLTVFEPGLAVTPGAIRDTVNFGAAAPIPVPLTVGNSGGGTITWTATKSHPWVSLSKTGGGAPPNETVIVTLLPLGLPAGTHRDTIVFHSPEATNDPLRVPVQLDILQARLVLTPDTITDTAPLGDDDEREHPLAITNGGGGPLNWTAVATAPWIELSKQADDRADTITVRLDPDDLPAGTHRGAIVVTAPGAANSPDSVAVVLTIQGACTVTPLVPDAMVTGTLTPADCNAPHRNGRRADLYGVFAAAGDTLSFRMTGTFDAYVILVDDDDDVMAQADGCPSEMQTACIRNFVVRSSGQHVVEATSDDPGETGAYTLTVIRERPPVPPQGLGQFRSNGSTQIPIGGTTPEDTVLFRGAVSDPNDTDSVRLEIEVEPLGSPFSDARTHESAWVSAANGSVPVTVRAGLDENTGYHWQARTCDRTGRCSVWLKFGENPETAADFTVSTGNTPSASGAGQFASDATTPIPLGGTAPATSVVLAATVTDPDPGDVLRLEIEVKETTEAFSGQDLRVVNALTSGERGGVLVSVVADRGYHWRFRACDQANRCSAWASFPQPNPNPETAADFRGPPPPGTPPARQSGVLP